MVSEVFSVKVSSELRDKLRSLMEESGLQGQGFMEQVIQTYELNTAKSLAPDVAGDVSELQAITNRIAAIFISQIERNANLMIDKDSIYGQELEKKDRTMSLVQGKLAEALAEVDRLKQEQAALLSKDQEQQEALLQSEVRLQEQDRNHQNLLDSKDALIKEYLVKIDALTSVVSEYQQDRDQNKVLTADIANLKARIEVLQDQVREGERTEENLRVEIERMKGQHELALMKMQMEQGNAMLALREQCQDRIDKLSAERQTLIDEYNSKVKELLDQIESLRAGKPGSIDAE